MERLYTAETAGGDIALISTRTGRPMVIVRTIVIGFTEQEQIENAKKLAERWNAFEKEATDGVLS